MIKVIKTVIKSIHVGLIYFTFLNNINNKQNYKNSPYYANLGILLILHNLFYPIILPTMIMDKYKFNTDIGRNYFEVKNTNYIMNTNVFITRFKKVWCKPEN